MTLVWQESFLQCLREGKPGGFQSGGFPTFLGKGPDCVADPFGNVPCRWAKKEEKDQSRKSPKIGEIPEN